MRVIVTCPDRNYVLVKILTSEPGLYGVGDATLNGRELAVATDLEKHLAPLLIGRDPEAIEDTWQYLYRGPYWRGGPVQMTALAGIDLALWDIKGKRAGMPVYQLLGGRTRVGALAYTHASGNDFTEVEDAVRRAMERGFKWCAPRWRFPDCRELTVHDQMKTSRRISRRGVLHPADIAGDRTLRAGALSAHGTQAL